MVQEGSLFSTPPPAFVLYGLINDGHYDWCEVVSHGSFEWISLVISDVEHCFKCLWAICMSFLEKCLFRSFGHVWIGLLAFLLLSCGTCLCILEIRPLSAARLTRVSATLWAVFLFPSLRVFSAPFPLPVTVLASCVFQDGRCSKYTVILKS